MRKMMLMLVAVWLISLTGCIPIGSYSHQPPRPAPEGTCRTLDGRVYHSVSVCRAVNIVLWRKLVDSRRHRWHR